MALRQDFGHIDPVDPGARRAVPQGALETLHGVEVPFHVQFQAAVFLIAHPPGNALEGRPLSHEQAKANALNAASYSESARRQQNLAIILSGSGA